LQKLIESDAGNQIKVATCVAVDERDTITVEDAATGAVIICKDYYSFNAKAWLKIVEDHFAGGAKPLTASK